MKSPYPYFGGKSRVASVIWSAFGDIKNYVEPFFGSGAVFLARPDWKPGFDGIETVNDKDCMISNFWRAVKYAPQAVAEYADWPVNENDLHARHSWLVGVKEDMRAKVEGDPDYYDAKVAGWWVWGMACWIGSGFCSGNGPWQVIDGQLVHLGNNGQGVTRQLVHLGNKGQGVSRRRVHINVNVGVNKKRDVLEYMVLLSQRFERVRVCSGDWSRVCGDTPTVIHGLTGVFLDPPYSEKAGRDEVYTVDSFDVAHDVREWCIERGGDKRMRICLAGYVGEHEELEAHGWKSHNWSASGGYSSRGKILNDNKHKEILWFSPHCVQATGESLFDLAMGE